MNSLLGPQLALYGDGKVIAMVIAAAGPIE